MSTCLECGKKLRKEYDFYEKRGYSGNGYFCTLRCGFAYGVQSAKRQESAKQEQR